MRIPAVRSLVVISWLLGGSLSYGQGANVSSPEDRLFARIYGAVAGAYIGNAIGVPVEGWTWEKIEKTYGFIDKMMGNPRLKDGLGQPGWTEDGMERYKLMCSAIIKKGGRITINELAKEWVQDIDPGKIGYRIGGQDRIIIELMRGPGPLAPGMRELIAAYTSYANDCPF